MIRFVTGTDTGVGKTVASAWLCARARLDGMTVRYCKPVQTGVEDDQPGDAAFVRQVANVEAFELTRLRDPLAPAVAAARENTTIDVAALVDRIRSLADGIDVLIVEGAGGLLVPLDDERTMADLAAALGATLVVVARPGLGTLNHIALTLEAAAHRNLPVETLILSGVPAIPDLAVETNIALLRAGSVPVELIPAFDGVSVESIEAGTFAP